ncbi:hypothetical protein BUPH_03012 [Paraburkholderia phenoliruptrix BR3459a]|uniref:Uncharacterized protein n=1 Tax=Paraburkholderia phenoliruptrix BR3459a TaxID=1229205 RepID=K0DPK1_9BURK|nr:hypothetical protein BUPH_03012 [Paraburkholderia phenoliruptrix BR3459a]
MTAGRRSPLGALARSACWPVGRLGISGGVLPCRRLHRRRAATFPYFRARLDLLPCRSCAACSTGASVSAATAPPPRRHRLAIALTEGRGFHGYASDDRRGRHVWTDRHCRIARPAAPRARAAAATCADQGRAS